MIYSTDIVVVSNLSEALQRPGVGAACDTVNHNNPSIHSATLLELTLIANAAKSAFSHYYEEIL